MRLKSFITLALLFVFSLSIVHEYDFISHDESHCATVEHVDELSEQTVDADICDVHCEFHQSFLLSQNIIVASVQYVSSTNPANKESYNFKTNLEFYKPPIS